VEIVAVSSDTPENNKALGLPFPVLSDPDLKVITAYGLLHPKAYMGRDVARPTTLLIAKGSREIQWLSAADNVRYRPTVEEVVEALRK
jgi:peroxiredoxin